MELLEEMRKNYYASKMTNEHDVVTVKCKKCGGKEDIQCSNGVKPTYWKCLNC